MKVLTVDDHPVTRRALAGAIRSLGHEVLTAPDGEAAWRLLGADPDLRVVVCDWRMPHLDGLELCRRVRAARTDYVGFLLLTQVEPSTQNLRDAYAAGIDDFLTKPVDVGELERRLNVAARILDFTTPRIFRPILPICSYCKSIRDEGDRWHPLENYLSRATGSRFSHSICPECFGRHVEPELRDLRAG